MQKNRAAGLDIIRTTAIALVLLTHMFAYTDVLNVNIGSAKWHIYNIIHYLSRICVPLFLLLTGYLQNRRKTDRKHYRSIIPVLVSYLAFCAIYIAADSLFMGNGFSAGKIRSVFDFSLGYSWYVEMYICLFLLIPFLNIVFDGCDKNKQLLLLGTLASITLLPSFLKGFAVNQTKLDVLPDFLENMYVITYYFIGAYIAKHRPHPNKLYCLIAAAITLLAEDLICAVSSSGEYAWQLFNSHASLSHTVVAVSVFLLFYDANVKNKFLCGFFKEISVCSFEMYLLSCLTDYALYERLNIPPIRALPLNFISVYISARLLRLVLVPLSNRLTSKLQVNEKTKTPVKI